MTKLLFLKIQTLIVLQLACLASAASGQSMPDHDPRSGWECAYPYSETNCQAILIAYGEDHDIDFTKIFDGFECSGCETEYVVDHEGTKHAVHSTCTQAEGARFTSTDFTAPIKRHKESDGKPFGWNVVDWSFTECFQTWNCNSECSLQNEPPVCIKMKVRNWGRYTPMLGGVCSYGQDGSDSQDDSDGQNGSDSQDGSDNHDDDQSGQSPGEDEEMERDTTWNPVY